MDIFSLQSNVLFVGFLIVLCLKGFAFVAAMTFPAPAYEAASKFTKVGWGLILGLGLAAQLILWSPIGIINILFLVAACVFLVDVRPALRSITRR
ncbi:DUF2516 family protein [Nocardioides jishulii]|uniref:DUF2516 family protein n=1 Tax=Nocardioides jishulii TaxID=2575440 RepID=A0A4U2YQK5_9ACTN|nr:DUF2516 family protein [Nocardioides jishulii]QCX26488.1 DUF2516 family protein [Nocardioides jishulii]TKI63706.1 DUF2516 family protein [Nocardioides jishulii]